MSKRATAVSILPVAITTVLCIADISSPVVSARASTTSAPSTTSAAIGAVTTVCGTRTLQVHVPDNTYYNVYNAPITQNDTCVKAAPGIASFTVTATDQHEDWGYPNVSSGWESDQYSCLDAGGACFTYPVEEKDDGTPETSLGVAMHGDGNASYDIWFDRSDAHPVQDNGTEIMIWMRHPGVDEYGSVPVSIEGISFRIMYWTARNSAGVTWHYAAYIMDNQRSNLHNFWLNDVFRDAISRGWLEPTWYLTGIDAGFELTSGGTGSTATLRLEGVR
jgi:hypothetical protein